MYVGIDLGGTEIKAGLVSDDLKIIRKDKVPTGATRHYSEIIKDMAYLAKKVVSDAGYDINKDIEHIGIGSPGACDSENGILVFAGNLNFDKVPMAEEMRKHINLPVYIGNDANAAALGEFYMLEDKEVKFMLAVTLGTGVGGGIIINKKIYEGFNGIAGELGHFQVMASGGEKCTCGREGCFEAHASVTALIRETKRAIEKNPDSLMAKMVEGDLGRVNGKTSFDAMRAGDAVAKEVVDNYIRHVGEGIVSLINIFQPEVVVIGGAISKEGEYLINPVSEIVKKNVFCKSVAQTKIRVSRLGNDAGIIGAAMLGKK